MDVYTCTFSTRIGNITVKATDEHIIGISVMNPPDYAKEAHEDNINELCREGYVQIKQYLSGRRASFDLPIQLTGTDFQKEVWRAAMQIPYGEIITYGQLAKMIGKPKSYRAVGGALHKNPLLLLVPCHRVNGSGGRLLGFAAGLPVKKHLQDFEFANRDNPALTCRPCTY